MSGDFRVIENLMEESRRGGTGVWMQYLGVGLYWAWIWVHFQSSILIPESMRATPDAIAIRLVGLIAMAPTLITGALLIKWSQQPIGSRIALTGAAFLGPVGTLAIVLVKEVPDSNWFVASLPGWIAMAVGSACLAMLWAQQIGTVDAEQLSIYVPASLALGSLVYFIVVYLQTPAGLVASVVLPLASVGMLLTAPRGTERTAILSTARRIPGVLWMVFGGLIVYGAAFGLLRGISVPLDNHSVDATDRLTLLGAGLVGLLIAVMMRLSSRSKALAFAYRLVLPAMVAGFLLLPFLGATSQLGASALAGTGYLCFEALMWIALFRLAHRLGLPPVRVFGLGRCATVLGLLAGWSISYLFLHSVTLDPTVLIVSALCAAFALVLANLFALNERDLLSLEGAGSFLQFNDAKEGGPGAWKKACAAVSAKYGLSPREEEVLLLLAKGRDSEFIQKELFISNATVKAHRIHIYRKLDIHSLQELIDMVEAHKATSER